MLFDPVEAIPIKVPSGTGLGLEADRDSIGDAVSITDRGG